MIQDIQAVSVIYHDKQVGTLSIGSKTNCQFEYDKDWLANGFSISPLQLPLKAGLFTADYQPFNGNFGIFEDSLPGGYSEYLLSKMLHKSGIDYWSLTPVQRLSLVGSSGMGALCYVPESKMFATKTTGTFDEVQQMALDVLAEKTDENADLLYFKSGNSGGVRPKCVFTDADGHWLVKFRHTYDPQNMGEIEYLYNVAARRCGIDVPEFKLIEGKFFAEKRFDIEDVGENQTSVGENQTSVGKNQTSVGEDQTSVGEDLAHKKRLHVATASSLLNEPISPPKMDYHSLLQLTGYLTQSSEAVEQQFRRMVFNVCANNFDDHARNFSFICREGRWSLAPAYDLTNDRTLGEHASTINFKGLPNDEDMITVGTNIRISRTRCMEIIEEVRTVTGEVLQAFI